jgi:hypothetical protein
LDIPILPKRRHPVNPARRTADPGTF